MECMFLSCLFIKILYLQAVYPQQIHSANQSRKELDRVYPQEHKSKVVTLSSFNLLVSIKVRILSLHIISQKFPYYTFLCTINFVLPVLVQHTRLVSRYHVFDVNERVCSAAAFKSFQSFLNKISDVFSSLLAVVDAIP